MQFLDAHETSLLHSILVNHVLIANEASRSDLLINCGLQSLNSALSTMGESALVFVNELCARLSFAHITAKLSGQPGLVALLNYISMPPYDVDLSPAEKKFLERVKQKCMQWHEAQTHEQDPPIHLLDQEHRSQQQLLSEAALASALVDREIIVNYGLYSLVAEFANQVNYGKASAFAIGGDFAILRDYVIERIRQELKRRIAGPQMALTMSLDTQDMAGDEDAILKKILNINRCNKLIDLFERHPKMHMMLVAWCYAIAPEQMQMAAARFWKGVEESVLPLLQAQNRCFVLVLANVDVGGMPYQIDKFTPLHTPLKFEVTDLLPWFRGKLENLDIEPSDIDYSLERLRDQRGDIARTYHEMEYIVSYLQERYDLSR